MSLKSANVAQGASLILSLAAVGCESSYDADALASTAPDATVENTSEDTSDNKSATKVSQSDTKPENENKSGAPLYALATIASAGDDSVSYVKLVDELEGQTLDFANAREFIGRTRKTSSATTRSLASW